MWWSVRIVNACLPDTCIGPIAVLPKRILLCVGPTSVIRTEGFHRSWITFGNCKIQLENMTCQFLIIKTTAGTNRNVEYHQGPQRKVITFWTCSFSFNEDVARFVWHASPSSRLTPVMSASVCWKSTLAVRFGRIKEGSGSDRRRGTELALHHWRWRRMRTPLLPCAHRISRADGRRPKTHMDCRWRIVFVCSNHAGSKGVLAYMVKEGCWCREHKLCDFAQPLLLQELVRGMESMRWRFVGSSNPETHRFEHTDATVKDWERQYAVAAEVPRCGCEVLYQLGTGCVCG